MIESELMLSFCVLGVLAVSPVFAVDQPGQRDLATEVKAVFQAKCAECHGPQVRKPKGKFEYVLDLKKLAADPEKVVPYKPEESQLWQLVSDEEMPPEEAKAGPLTKEQKQIIHDWIAAGAPSTPIARDDPSPANKAAESASTPAAERHLLDWLGNLHVVVVHFPIALLLAAAAGELWFASRRVRQPAPAVRFCVLSGAVSAIVAAILGWLHAASGYGVGSPLILAWHRWLGTASGAGSVVLAVFSEIDNYRGVQSWWFRLLLFLDALLVAHRVCIPGRRLCLRVMENAHYEKPAASHAWPGRWSLAVAEGVAATIDNADNVVRRVIAESTVGNARSADEPEWISGAVNSPFSPRAVSEHSSSFRREP